MNFFTITQTEDFQWFLQYTENGTDLVFPREDTSELETRINEAFEFASNKPIANENLRKTKRWLYFQGLTISETIVENTPTLTQQIVQYLKNEISHGFNLCSSNGTNIVLKGILLLIAIAYYYNIKIIIFSSRKKPLKIVPKKTTYTIALLYHQDSILSIGMWYPLGLVKNWTKRTAKVPMDYITVVNSLPAILRPENSAKKRKKRADYKSIGDNTLKRILNIVM